MNDTIMSMLDTASLDDLLAIKEAVAAKIKARREEAKLAEKEAKLAAAEAGVSLKSEVKVGTVVEFTYKGGTKRGTVVKVTEKTFHVDATEAGLDGEGMRYIQFAKLVRIAA